MKKVLAALLLLALAFPPLALAGTVAGDADANGYLDINKGGTNNATGLAATATALAANGANCNAGYAPLGVDASGAVESCWQVQAYDADLTTYAGITPSADIQTLLGYANFAAIKAGLSIDDLVTLSGVADGAVNLGTFTGSTIADNVTIKAALQAIETAVAKKVVTHSTTTPVDLTCVANSSGVFTNSGASANITYTLEECVVGVEGCHFTFIITDVEDDFWVDPHANDLYYGMYSTNAAGDKLAGDKVIGSILNAICLKNTAGVYNWMTSGNGVWSDAN